MTDEEFDLYLDEALDEMDKKHEYLIAEYGIGDHSDFVVDYDTQLLMFYENDNPVVEATILPLATHDPAKNNLVWFWSDPNVPQAIRTRAASIKTLYEITGSDLFITNNIECGETMLWELAALVCKGLNSEGVHRVPHDGLNSYVLIEAIKHYKDQGDLTLNS